MPRQNITHMGFSIRVATSRYIEWRHWQRNCAADWSPAGLVAKEMYDHTGDQSYGPESFDDYEYENLAYQPAYAQLVAALAGELAKQFDHAGNGRNPSC